VSGGRWTDVRNRGGGRTRDSFYDALDAFPEAAGDTLPWPTEPEPEPEPPPEPEPASAPAAPPPLEPPPARELIVEHGKVRQAGADLGPEGAFITAFRRRAEASLYTFAKGVLGRRYLSPTLHVEVCRWLQAVPPQRKLLLLPREHAKTTIVSHALPLHILIQPADGNRYFPGEPGTDQRIILACETEKRACDHVRVVRTQLESNALLRALWPAVCWERPAKDAKVWNNKEFITPRAREYPDPSLRAIGVDGAITGAHPTALLKDDLISLDAANSPLVMQTAVDWHIASRALINAPKTLEFIIGTRWAVSDLYQFILDTDPTVQSLIRAIVEDGRTIYPEAFSTVRTPGCALVDDLLKQFGVLFPLLYMNSAANPALTDFDPALLRTFTVVDGRITFEEDERDALLVERVQAPATLPPIERGRKLSEVYDALMARGRYLVAKWTAKGGAA
jgi:hypothetical protein